jgi:hypothetical protein
MEIKNNNNQRKEIINITAKMREMENRIICK